MPVDMNGLTRACRRPCFAAIAAPARRLSGKPLDYMEDYPLTDSQLLEAVQSRAARIAVGASTVRGRGNAGVVAASRRYLRGIDLEPFGRLAQNQFFERLGAATLELRDALPRGARHWGLARKVMNIFLRDCLYTTYLDEAFGLRKNEAYFELPLDSITAAHLKRAAGRGKLPSWPGVKHLTARVSTPYQEAASTEAAKRGISRIHLDAFWWSMSRDDDAV